MVWFGITCKHMTMTSSIYMCRCRWQNRWRKKIRNIFYVLFMLIVYLVANMWQWGALQNRQFTQKLGNWKGGVQYDWARAGVNGWFEIGAIDDVIWAFGVWNWKGARRPDKNGSTYVLHIFNNNWTLRVLRLLSQCCVVSRGYVCIVYHYSFTL